VILSTAGESRVNGYLYVLDRALRSFLPRDTAADAVREIESHVRERISTIDAVPDERSALERVLAELGPPMRVAQAYSAERTFDEAVATGRFMAILSSIGHLATTTVLGFFAALAIFIGYITSFAFLAIAILKPIFPNNVGIQFIHGVPVGLSAHFPVGDADLRGGYWIVPLAVLFALGVFTGTHRGARRFIAWMRGRTAAAALLRTQHRV
jgi:uncharacterized membrane protein